MRALVSGAGGFQGRHLVAFLTSQAVEVHTLGPHPTSPHHHLSGPTDQAALTMAVEAAQPDWVFHLAGIASGLDQAAYYTINVAYAAALLQSLETAGRAACPTLLVGSAAEYGLIEIGNLPIDEDTPPRPYNHYGLSKLTQTRLGLLAAQQGGRPVVITRPFNVIGPSMPPHLALQSFAAQVVAIKRGQQPPRLLVGNLASQRDFVGVAQVVESYWQLIQTPAAYGQTVNLCSGQPVTLAELLDRLIRLSGVSIEVVTDPARVKPLDLPIHYGNPAKLQALLGDRLPPAQSLDQILQDVLDGVS